MQAISVMMWEVELSEIAQLPDNTEVLQRDTKFGISTVKITGRDKFPTNARFKFFLMDEPPLPQLNPEYEVGAR